jgi:hypothetical protein
MKHFIPKTLLVICTLFVWTGMGMADTIRVTLGSADDPIGYFSGNDRPDDVKKLVTEYNILKDPDLPTPLTLFGKWEYNDKTLTGKWETDNPGFSISVDDTNSSGTWSFDGSWDTTNALYYSLKAGNEFALYYVGVLTTGNSTIGWEVDWTQGKSSNFTELSHISFWTAKADSTNPVPEPGTLALVGLGLATIAGYRRKRHAG